MWIPPLPHVIERARRRHARDTDPDRITTRDGLLVRHGAYVMLPAADALAVACGFRCAEQFVRDLEQKGDIHKGPILDVGQGSRAGGETSD